jgi:hypothetical protein
MKTLKKLIIAAFLAGMLTSFSGCTAVIAGGGVIAKAVSWLTFWKKDDPATAGMSETERIKAAFSEYVATAEKAMNSAKNEAAPAKPADTEDISYTQAVNTETLDSYHFFSVWLENYQKAHPNSDFSEIGGQVTESNLSDFFKKHYFSVNVSGVYKQANGVVLADESAANGAAASRAAKRGRLAELETEIAELEKPTETSPDVSETAETVPAETTDSGLSEKYAEKARLETEIADTKITAAITVNIGRNANVVADLGLEAENVDAIYQLLKEALK